MWMNEYEIDEAVSTLRNHPVLGDAARFLRDFKDEVNSHSDGWPYWRLPPRAAGQLMTVLHTDPETVTPADVRKALGPIKSFMTRRGNAAGMTMPRLPGEKPAEPEGIFLSEDNGATLYCDACHQQVRSNEAHRCKA